MSDTREFKALLEDECHPPIVFKHVIDSWPARKWTVKYLAEVMQDKKFQCKVAPTDYEDVLMETECLHIQCSLQHYGNWFSGGPGADNPLSLFNPTKYSCYVDYKYMKDMFKECPEMLKDVDWEMFGFPDRDGTDSTIWIGSMGAYTPCHQDTYGFNLVAQISGRKRWYIFPPSACEIMYPSRIPFEESSVFSEVSVRYPDLKKHPLFQRAEPYVVILGPGDVLYVPRHWWHFVECLEPSISVNTWVDMKEDTETHLKEAVTRFLFSSMASIIPGQNLLNSYEELEAPTVNISYIHQALTAFLGTRREKRSCSEWGNEQSEEKQKVISDGKVEHVIAKCSEECYSPVFVNNFQQFMEAFKGQRVIIPHADIRMICSCSKGQSKSKRQRSHSEEEKRLQSCKSCVVSHNGSAPTFAKVPKHETQFGKTNQAELPLKTDACSDSKKLCRICAEQESKKQYIKEQDPQFVVTTDCCKGTLQLETVPKFSCEDYLEFLKLEFGYDKTIFINTDQENDKRLEVETEDTAENISKADKFSTHLMNSVLNQSVVNLICQNLMKKYK